MGMSLATVLGTFDCISLMVYEGIILVNFDKFTPKLVISVFQGGVEALKTENVGVDQNATIITPRKCNKGSKT